MGLAERLRSEARRLIEAAKSASDPEAKQKIAHRCIELSHRAELIEMAETRPELIERYIRFCQYRLAGGLSDAEYREVVEHLLSDLNELLVDLRTKKLSSVSRAGACHAPRTGSRLSHWAKIGVG
jgi:hypothetical protein